MTSYIHLWDREMEDVFTRKWDAQIAILNSKKEKLLESYYNLVVICEHMEGLKTLFKKLYYKKDMVPNFNNTKQRALFLLFYTKNYFLCLLLTIDDIVFLKNGRILTNGRLSEVQIANDLETTKKNYHHQEFSNDADGLEESEEQKGVELAMNCYDNLQEITKDMRKNFKNQYREKEDILFEKLSEAQLHLTFNMKRSLCMSPDFLLWVKAKKELMEGVMGISNVEKELDGLELKIRKDLKDLAEMMHGTCNSTVHFNESVSLTLFTERVTLTRERLANWAEKNMLKFRTYISAELLPDNANEDFKFVAVVLEEMQQELDNKQSSSTQRSEDEEFSSPSGSNGEDLEDDDGMDEESATSRKRGSAMLQMNRRRSHEQAIGKDADAVDGEDEEYFNPTTSSRKKRKEGPRGVDGVDLVPFLYNNDLYNTDLLDTSQGGYARSITFNGKNLVEALSQNDVISANALIDAVFEACCVDDVCNDVRSNVVREQNVVAFSNLKRLVSGCNKDEVVEFDFKQFFQNVFKRVYDLMKIIRKDVADGGSGSLERWEHLQNEFLSRRIKSSVHRLKLRYIYTYAHLNDQVDTLDLTLFKKCGFLTIYDGVVKACSIPLTNDALLEITGGHEYTNEDMEVFKNETLSFSKKVKKSAVKSLQLAKEEKVAKRKERAAAKEQEAKVSKSPTTVAEVNNFLTQNRIAVDVETQDTHSTFLPLTSSAASDENVVVVSRTVAAGNSAGCPPFTCPEVSCSSSQPQQEQLQACVPSQVQQPQIRPQVQQHHQQSSSSSSSLISGSASSVKDIFNKVFMRSVGEHDALKIEFISSARPDLKCLSALAKIVQFVSLNKNEFNLGALLAQEAACLDGVYFALRRAFEVGGGDLMIDSENTRGDGYCLFRATLQAQDRSKNPTLSLEQLKASDWVRGSDKLVAHIKSYVKVINYANFATQELMQTKLDECIFNAEILVGATNPYACWCDSSLLRFLKFDMALFDFSSSDTMRVDIKGTHCRWGNLSRIPFHYFDNFFDGEPKLTITQLRVVTTKSNYIGFSSGHNFVLPTPSRDLLDLNKAFGNWIDHIIAAVQLLSTSELQVVDAFAVRNDAKLKATAIASVSFSVNQNESGVIDVSTDSLTREAQRDHKNKPLCHDNYFKKLDDGRFNKEEVDDLCNSLKFLRERLAFLKNELVKQGPVMTRRSKTKSYSSTTTVYDLASEQNEGTEAHDADLSPVNAEVNTMSLLTSAVALRIATPPSETPPSETPRSETPRSETPTPRSETPQSETPRSETPQSETPRSETPQSETPQSETPQSETPQSETPQSEKSQSETPQSETPRSETPRSETLESMTPLPPFRSLSWHCSQQLETRAIVCKTIASIMSKRRPNATSAWWGRLPEMTTKLEQALYDCAHSWEEYAALDTVAKRIASAEVLATSKAGSSILGPIAPSISGAQDIVQAHATPPPLVNEVSLLLSPGSWSPASTSSQTDEEVERIMNSVITTSVTVTPAVNKKRVRPTSVNEIMITSPANSTGSDTQSPGIEKVT